VPEVGESCVLAILRKVVFPAPFLPRRVNILPSSIERSKLSRAGSSFPL
jgi:hypothetical protein